VSKARALILEITDPDSFRMRIDMSSLPGIDYALNMLGQAIRILEAKQRFLAEQELVANEMQKAAEQQLVSTLRKQ
jgi:hypothetical protein